jgi:hypothetical protein
MSSHLKGFYPDAHSDSINSSINSNNQNDSNIASPVSSLLHTTDSSEYEKKISLITKKLRSYEKKRQKLFFESKKNQDKSEATGDNETEIKDEHVTLSELSDKKSKSGSSNTINTGGMSNGSSGSGGGGSKEAKFPLTTIQSAPHPLVHSNTTANLLNVPNGALQKAMPSDEILFNQFKSFNFLNGDSALNLNSNEASTVINSNGVKASLSNVTNVPGAVLSNGNLGASNNNSALNPFYLNSELNANDLFGANSETNPNEDNSGSAIVNNKSNNSLDRERNVVRRKDCNLFCFPNLKKLFYQMKLKLTS